MKITISHQHKFHEIDLSQPQDISIPLGNGTGPNCFNAPAFEYEPVRGDGWIGRVADGCPVNFMNVRLNPHGNGTHTECVGHIAPEVFSINTALREYHFVAKLATLYPQRLADNDRIITREMLAEVLCENEVKAFILRTMPNDDYKKTTNYSGSNAPYLTTDAMQYIVDCGVEHLLLDLPSVDKEDDGGAVAAHHIFWQYPHNTRYNATITEMIYVKNELKDGLYFLNLQIPSFTLDAAPSKPVLFYFKNSL
ncbi:MAG: hypothetical protein RI894_2307 [Bacteroidota bacterium]|jgi:kynurenine formamidase